MKSDKYHFRLFPLVLFLFIASISSAQHNYYGSYVPPLDRSPFHLILTINPQDGAYLKKDLGTRDLMTTMHGEKVLGTPFLLYEWSEGSLTTADGRSYTYPLRYNVFDQLVSFMNGADTLDVTDAIKEFSLNASVNDTAVVLHFINADQYKKEKKTFYYQVILDSKKGQLLKTYQKSIASLTDGLLESKGTKYFDLKSDYYYYNKDTKKISKIKADGSDLQEVLEPGNKSSLHFSDDEELIRYLKNYFGIK